MNDEKFNNCRTAQAVRRRALTMVTTLVFTSILTSGCLTGSPHVEVRIWNESDSYFNATIILTFAKADGMIALNESRTIAVPSNHSAAVFTVMSLPRTEGTLRVTVGQDGENIAVYTENRWDNRLADVIYVNVENGGVHFTTANT